MDFKEECLRAIQALNDSEIKNYIISILNTIKEQQPSVYVCNGKVGPKGAIDEMEKLANSD